VINMKIWRRLGGIVTILSVVMAVAFVGGAGTAQAATLINVTLTPLIGSGDNVIQQVTYGGKIGYHLKVENGGQSTTQFVQIVVTSDSATYLDDDSDLCGAYPGNNLKMLCTPQGGTLAPGDKLEVNFRFTAPLTGSQVSTDAAVTVAAKSVGGSNNQGTTVATTTCPAATPCPVLTTLVANGTKDDTFLRAHDHAATGNFSLDTPNTLLGDPFGIAVSIHDEVGTPICDTCLTSFTTLTIPAASFVSTPGNPFYDGTFFNPYSWTMSAHYSGGFQLTGIYHVEDGSTTPHFVPNCATLDGNAPTVGEPLCFDDTITWNKGAKTLSAHGRGLENGNIGYG
jgi:hypothetical protein